MANFGFTLSALALVSTMYLPAAGVGIDREATKTLILKGLKAYSGSGAARLCVAESADSLTARGHGELEVLYEADSHGRHRPFSKEDAGFLSVQTTCSRWRSHKNLTTAGLC